MTSRRAVYDTNVIIRHQLADVPGFVSAVVLQELTAGARDVNDLRRLGSVRAAAEEGGVLLTPDGEDWYHTGKVLNALHRGLRSHRAGHTPSIPKDEQHRLLRDVLIARTAKRMNVPVVTYNRADFQKIRRFCDVRVVNPARFL